MAGFEHTHCTLSLCDDFVVEDHTDMACNGLDTRRAWIIPHRFLAGLRLLIKAWSRHLIVRSAPAAVGFSQLQCRSVCHRRSLCAPRYARSRAWVWDIPTQH